MSNDDDDWDDDFDEIIAANNLGQPQKPVVNWSCLQVHPDQSQNPILNHLRFVTRMMIFIYQRRKIAYRWVGIRLQRFFRKILIPRMTSDGKYSYQSKLRISATHPLHEFH